jgi:hypothetical protein
MAAPARMRLGSRSQGWHPLVVAMALCALVLRLGAPPPVPVDAEIGLTALFGEHVLCVSGAVRADQDLVPSTPAAPARGQHDNHHAGWCCHWHATAAIVPPATDVAVRVYFATPTDRVTVAAIAPPIRRGGSAQPRAPPKS